ncbi:serine/threonine protein phosphatase 1 [Bradyrhizobium sp. USDA 4341]
MPRASPHDLGKPMPQTNPITFAIGDIHGECDALKSTIEACRRYANGRPTTFVLLGDYIDRGPDSKSVLEFLMNWKGPELLICLRGNHEDMLLLTLANSEPASVAWLGNGGAKTLLSFGATHAHQLPQKISAWLETLPLSFDDGRRFFCHAGIDPTRPLDEQTDAILMYSKFDYPADIEIDRYIVHGHIPNGRLPRVYANRINLDTGSGYGGPLSAAAFVKGQPGPVALIVASKIIELSQGG